MTLLNITNTQQPECKSSSCETKQGEKVRSTRPRYRVRALDTEFVATVDLPGVTKDAVELSVVDGVLEITGTRSWQDRDGWNALAGVVEDGLSYRLRLELGDQVDAEKISADLQDGVLKLTLAKAEEKKPRRITVS